MSDSTNVAYAPDIERITDAARSSGLFLIHRGDGVLRAPHHGREDRLRETIEQVEADTVILVNLSDHKNRKHTGDFGYAAAALGYCLGDDGMKVTS